MNIKEILEDAARAGASDIFLIGGLPLTYKIEKHQQRIDPERRLMPDQLEELIRELYQLVGRTPRNFAEKEDDFSFAIRGCGRFRANVFNQRGCASAVIRVIRFGIPDALSLGLPPQLLNMANLSGGLALVTGPAGSGKTTTLACVIDEINRNQERTIITMEDPIEIVHSHQRSIVIQREISTDTESFSSALKAALREAPDVMLIGEIRDGETMETAMMAAETGQLLFSSLHTLSAADTVDRILDFYPDKKQPQIRAQLARVLKWVVCQKLVPTTRGRAVPVFEIMVVTPAIQNLIREGKTYQFASVIREGGRLGMQTMNSHLLELVERGIITENVAMMNSNDPTGMEKRLNRGGI